MFVRTPKLVFASLLLSAAPALIALALAAPQDFRLGLVLGLLVLALLGGWGATILILKSATEEAIQKNKEKMAQFREPIHKQTTLVHEKLCERAQRLTTLTDDHQQKASASTSAAAQATESATIIASAIEEMNGAIIEIGRQADEATTIANGAAEKAKIADKSANSLSDKGDQILSIVELIRTIAERTNLLALNATIEAARAGEHGKGFAVVASEVKTLAKQTAEATTQIESQINEIRTAAHDMKSQMREIEDTVERINAITKTIKTALHEETSAAHEIARSAGETSGATNRVTEGISHMLVTTEQIRATAEGLSKEIATLCKGIEDAVDRDNA